MKQNYQSYYETCFLYPRQKISANTSSLYTHSGKTLYRLPLGRGGVSFLFSVLFVLFWLHWEDLGIIPGPAVRDHFWWGSGYLLLLFEILSLYTKYWQQFMLVSGKIKNIWFLDMIRSAVFSFQQLHLWCKVLLFLFSMFFFFIVSHFI